VSVYKCVSVQMHQCTNASVYECASVRIRQCTNASVYKCINVRMHQCTNASVYECVSNKVTSCWLSRCPLFCCCWIAKMDRSLARSWQIICLKKSSLTLTGEIGPRWNVSASGKSYDQGKPLDQDEYLRVKFLPDGNLFAWWIFFLLQEKVN
jgi:hypothetical protein